MNGYILCLFGELQETSERPFPGCENASGKLRQKWLATAETKFTKPGNSLLEVPCIFRFPCKDL